MTRYLLRGALGYLRPGPSISWTRNAEDAQHYATSVEAHNAARIWRAERHEHLSVVVRDGARLTPFTEMLYR